MKLIEMQKELLDSYQEKYKRFEEIAFQLNKMNEPELEKIMINKMAGLTLMIRHLKEIVK
jgi:ribosomal protein L5